MKLTALWGPPDPESGIPELPHQPGDYPIPHSTIFAWRANLSSTEDKGSVCVSWIVSIETLQVHSCHSHKRELWKKDSRHNYGYNSLNIFMFLGQVVRNHVNGSRVNHPWSYKRWPRNKPQDSRETIDLSPRRKEEICRNGLGLEGDKWLVCELLKKHFPCVRTHGPALPFTLMMSPQSFSPSI